MIRRMCLRSRQAIRFDRIAKVISENTAAWIEMIALGLAMRARKSVWCKTSSLGWKFLIFACICSTSVNPCSAKGLSMLRTCCVPAGVSYFAMQANFHHMERYPQLHYTGTIAPTEAGDTWAGRLGIWITNPSFQIQLGGLSGRDLLLMDFQLAVCFVTSDLAAIRRREPVLSGVARKDRERVRTGSRV